jgi:hypothetical protein
MIYHVTLYAVVSWQPLYVSVAVYCNLYFLQEKPPEIMKSYNTAVDWIRQCFDAVSTSLCTSAVKATV